jgi:hypothetical protein
LNHDFGDEGQGREVYYGSPSTHGPLGRSWRAEPTPASNQSEAQCTGNTKLYFPCTDPDFGRLAEAELQEMPSRSQD